MSERFGPGISTAWNLERRGGQAVAVAALVAARARCLAYEIPADARRSASDADRSAREAEAERWREGARAAAALRAPQIVVHAGRIAVAEGRRLLAVLAGGGEAAEARRELAAARAREREAAVDRLCRALHAFVALPDVPLPVLALDAHPAALLGAEETEWVLGELGARRLGLRHDVGAAALRERLGLEDAAVWTQRFGDRFAGVWLHDLRGDEGGFCPGEGDLDWSAILAALPGGAPRILKVSPASRTLAVAESLKLVG